MSLSELVLYIKDVYSGDISEEDPHSLNQLVTRAVLKSVLWLFH